MGEVYRARDPRLGREVAIKLIPETFATDASRLHRFEQEARAAGQLNHPNILAVYDVGIARRARRTSSRSCSRANRSAAGCAKAPLAAAQSHRLRAPDRRGARRRARQGHRPPRREARQPVRHERRTDQDPRLRHRQAHAARRRRRSAHRARSPRRRAGTVMGTAGYMSPEQVRGETVDAPVRHLQLRRGPLRDAHRASGVHPRDGGRDDGRHPEGGSAGAAHRRTFRRRSRASSRAVWRRRARRGFSRRAIWRSAWRSLSGTSGTASPAVGVSDAAALA